MALQNRVFQPGIILHEVITGTLRAKGGNLSERCKSNNLSVTTVRNVTFGQSAGPRNQGLLERVIDAAGREVVTAAYRIRMGAEAQKLAQTARVAA